MTKLIEQSIDKIESWLAKKGFALLKSKLSTIQDEVDFDRKVVFLSLRSKPEYQLYSLLHECGHVIIRTRKDYRLRYAASAEREENPSKNETNRSIVEQIDVVSTNYKMMQLYTPSISVQGRNKIKWALDEFDFLFNKTEFVKMTIEDGFGSGDWTSLFQSLNNISVSNKTEKK